MNMTGILRCLTPTGALWLVSTALVFAQTQGVSQNEVVVGYMGDLSGPVAGYGKGIRDGMIMRIEEINAQGGVHGRKIRLLVEDNAYDPKRTVLAAQKLVNQSGIFAAIGTFGTVHALAAMRVQAPKGVFNVFPMTLSRDMYEPLNRLNYAWMPSYFDQISMVAPYLYKGSDARKACTLYQDDDFGYEIVQGAQAGLQKIGTTLHERTSFKRGATDFASQVARLKSAGCDFVVLGALVRETVGVISEARRLGYSPTFIVTSSTYTDLVPKLGGAAMDGLYASHTAAFPYLDDASEAVRTWANRYQARFNENPTVFSAYGYTKIDLFAKALELAGPQLTADSFVRGMESLDVPGDIFGNPPLHFSDKQHLGSNKSRLSQLQDGRWKVVAEYDQFGQ